MNTKALVYLAMGGLLSVAITTPVQANKAQETYMGILEYQDQTNEGQSFFVYLRLYGPEQGYFDQSFPMNKIQQVK